MVRHMALTLHKAGPVPNQLPGTAKSPSGENRFSPLQHSLAQHIVPFSQILASCLDPREIDLLMFVTAHICRDFRGFRGRWMNHSSRSRLPSFLPSVGFVP